MVILIFLKRMEALVYSQDPNQITQVPHFSWFDNPVKNALKRFFNKAFSCFGFNKDLHVFVKFGEQSVLRDSAVCVPRLV